MRKKKKKSDDDTETPEPKTDLLEGEGKGVGPQENNPAVEKAARAYKKVRDERMELTKQEVVAKAVLLETMKDQDVKLYRFDDQEVKFTAKENVKVRTIGGDDDSDDE